MKILVTGALGHIGSRLIRFLPQHFPGSEIHMVDNMLTQRYSSLFNLPNTASYKFIEEDITEIDTDSLLTGIDVVIHLAAITDAAGSFDKAEVVENNNFNATKRVAEACAKHNVRLIAISSTSVYGTQESVVDENCTEDELKPQSPYAFTKLREERLVQSLVKNNGLRAVIFRFGTIFGVSQGMRFHTAVNKFCWQAVMRKPITVWKTAYDQKRPYLDLHDAMRAIEFVITNNRCDGNVYNVVTLNATVREVVESIRAQVGSIDINFVDSPIMNQLSYEVMNTRFSNEGFVTVGNLADGVGDTVNLIKNSYNITKQ